MKNKKKLYATIFLLTIVMFFVSVYSYIAYKQKYKLDVVQLEMTPYLGMKIEDYPNTKLDAGLADMIPLLQEQKSIRDLYIEGRKEHRDIIDHIIKYTDQLDENTGW